MNLAIIPARGGSRRIPRKNIRDFVGKPMIAYAIDAAHASKMFEHVIVSSDDPEIIERALAYGAKVPFTRPANLADDFTPTIPVIAHAMQECIDLGWEVDHVCCIYPSVPFLEPEDLKQAFSLMTNTGAAFSFPVAEFPAVIQRALRRLPDGHMIPIQPEYELTRTQDIEPSFYDAGQFYWGSAQSWHTRKHIHKAGVGLPIPNWRVVDIDTPEDWTRAEILYKTIKQMRN